jgi:formate-dependent phosphoribosylglycinamide formyltransferase (GAR transformylase)
VAIKKAIKAADKLSAWAEAVQIAGFSVEEANRLFGKPDQMVMRGLSIKLEPPATVRAAFVARHQVLLAAC